MLVLRNKIFNEPELNSENESKPKKSRDVMKAIAGISAGTLAGAAIGGGIGQVKGNKKIVRLNDELNTFKQSNLGHQQQAKQKIEELERQLKDITKPNNRRGVRASGRNAGFAKSFRSQKSNQEKILKGLQEELKHREANAAELKNAYSKLWRKGAKIGAGAGAGVGLAAASIYGYKKYRNRKRASQNVSTEE